MINGSEVARQPVNPRLHQPVSQTPERVHNDIIHRNVHNSRRRSVPKAASAESLHLLKTLASECIIIVRGEHAEILVPRSVSMR